MRRHPRLVLRVLLPAATAALLVVLGAAALSHWRGGDVPVEVRTAAGSETVVFAEFGPTEDRVYAAPADDPSRRRLVATIEHVHGWGINPAASVVGSLAAYTVLAPGSEPRRDAPAELWLLDLASGQGTRLASDADLLAPPVFDAAGSGLVYRSTRSDGTQEVVSVDLDSRLRRPVYVHAGSFGVYPVGYAATGEVLFAVLSTAGTDIEAVRAGEPPRLVVHASDHIARDWRVSPDGREVSYLAPELTNERWVYRLRVASVEDGAQRTLDATAAARAEQFGPVWTPDGAAVTVGVEAYPAASAPAMTLSLRDGSTQALPAPPAGFDVPLGWSPAGQYLVARSFDGATSYEPGRESIVVISPDGERRPIATAAQLIFVGWMSSG